MATLPVIPTSDANDRKEWYPVGLQNLQLKRNASGEPIYPQQAVESHIRAWRSLYWLRGQVQEILARLNVIQNGPIVGPDARPASPQGDSIPPGAVTTIFQGMVVVLSPFPFLDNPISGQYLTDLYNFLQSVPGAWEYGCIQGGSGYYIWPYVDGAPPLAQWAPYLVVGDRVIHKPDVC